MIAPDELKALFDRIQNGQVTEADIHILHQLLQVNAEQSIVQLGKYNINIGQGQDIQIGDRIYKGIDADAIKEAVRAVWQENQWQSEKSKQVLWHYRHTFKGHSDVINAVVITPDSKTLISASDDKTIKIWNLNPPHLHLTLPEQDEEVTCVAITPDNKILISGDKEGTVKIWDLQTCKVIKTPSRPYKNTKHIHAIAVSPDSKTFAISSSEKTVQIWSLDPVHLLHTSSRQEAEIKAIAITSDSKELISGDEDGTVQIWDLLTGELIKSLLNVHSKSVNSLALSLDGELFATGSSDKTIKLWDLRARNLRKTFNEEGGSEEEGDTAINAIAFCPDNETLISGSEGSKFGFGLKFYRGGTIRIWNCKTEKLLQIRSRAHNSPITSIAVSPDGQILATASKGGTIIIWQKAKS